VADCFILGVNFLLIPSYNKQISGKQSVGGGGEREVSGVRCRECRRSLSISHTHTHTHGRNKVSSWPVFHQHGGGGGRGGEVKRNGQQTKERRADKQPCFTSSSAITSSTATATVKCQRSRWLVTTTSMT